MESAEIERVIDDLETKAEKRMPPRNGVMPEDYFNLGYVEGLMYAVAVIQQVEEDG